MKALPSVQDLLLHYQNELKNLKKVFEVITSVFSRLYSNYIVMIDHLVIGFVLKCCWFNCYE